MSYFIYSQTFPFYTLINVPGQPQEDSPQVSDNTGVSQSPLYIQSVQANSNYIYESENFIYPSYSVFLSQAEPKMEAPIRGNQQLLQTSQNLAQCKNGQEQMNCSTNLLAQQTSLSRFPDQSGSCQRGKINFIKKQKTILEDFQEYLPLNEQKKVSPYVYQENQNRNIIPNEINQIISFIQKKNKSGHIITKLLAKYPHHEQFTAKRFYLYQSLLKNKIGHYTNQKSLRHVAELYEPKCEIYSESQQRYYNKLCRVMIRHFLYQESIFMILTSKRMKSEKKRDHLRAKRSLNDAVIDILRGC